MDEGRLLVEIESWEWSPYVGISPEIVPVDERFQGGLLYTRGIEIAGRVRGPKDLRGLSIAIWVSPLSSAIVFSADLSGDVGRFYRNPESTRADLGASLWFPEADLANAITCLGTIWRYAHIWLDGADEDPAGVHAFTFSREIPLNLREWAQET
jgi:hypothetical protein